MHKTFLVGVPENLSYFAKKHFVQACWQTEVVPRIELLTQRRLLIESHSNDSPGLRTYLSLMEHVHASAPHVAPASEQDIQLWIDQLHALAHLGRAIAIGDI